MNLSVNTISFNGKKEVIYALKNAAKEARQAELHRAASFGPRPINKQELVKERTEVLQAYMDMAVFDDTFEQVIKELPTLKDGAEIKNSLKPEKLQWGETCPQQLFENSMVVNCMTQKKNVSVDILNKFLNFLR